MHETALIEDLAVILCVASIVIVLFQKIKQPLVLGYLLAGIIVGPYTPPFSFIDDEADIRVLAELGVIFLLFTLGLEFSFRKLAKVGFSAIVIGFFEVLSMIIVGYMAGMYLDWNTFESLLLGSALAISSTTIIIKALEEQKLKKLFFAELMVGVLLIEDMLAILLMVFISTSGYGGNVLSGEIFGTAFKLMLVVASWFLIGYFAIPYLMRKIHNDINHESLTIIAAGLCLFLSSVASYFNYSTALGAFIMGSILAETRQVHRIERLTLPIRDIFGAIFFVSVGMLIDPMVIFRHWPTVLLLSLITIIGKIIIAGIGSLLSGQTLTTSIRIGFGMAQIGEFSFIIVGLGGTMQGLNQPIYPIIVAISAVTTFATPYLIKYALKITQTDNHLLSKGLYHLLRQPRKGGSSRFFFKISQKHFPKGESIIRFCINGIIVAIICTLATDFVLQALLKPLTHLWTVQMLTWSAALFAASPFIWAMIFGKTSVASLEISYRNIFCWLLVILELYVLAFARIPLSMFIAVLGVQLFFIFAISPARIGLIYCWFENLLIKNLSQKDGPSEKMLDELSSLKLEVVSVDKHEFLANQSIAESKAQEFFQGRIVGLERKGKRILNPKEDTILQKGDMLLLIHSAAF